MNSGDLEEREFEPALLSSGEKKSLVTLIERANDLEPFEFASRLRGLADTASEDCKSEVGGLRLAVASSILADLIEQGWLVRAANMRIRISPPSAKKTPGESLEAVKARLRSAMQIASDRQLATPAVREFVAAMERNRIFKGKIVSIKSLVDDGRDLAKKFSQIVGLKEEQRFDAIAALIQPVIQVCDYDAVCKQTGLYLQDIWRYFRHTWATEYNPLPGRTLRVLIRNKARPNCPVIGIALLASAGANLYVRDEWIGWRLDKLINNLITQRWNAEFTSKALMHALQTAIKNIRSDDLISRAELKNLTKAGRFRLQQLAAGAQIARLSDLAARANRKPGARSRGKLTDIRDLKARKKGGILKLTNAEWKALSSTSLFRRKRAEQLLPILESVACFNAAGFKEAPGASLLEMLIDKRGRDAVSVALNEIKKQKLATEVADLSVCGAIEPYSHLLGGKLVALLMCSHEMRRAYRNRYSAQPSEISSQIAGRRMIRSAELKVLTTTSLYGIGSSQYNRLKLRAGIVPGLKSDLIWNELDSTVGHTVTHISKLTLIYMRKLGEHVYGARRVNGVFGEGSSPKLRQIREGLNLIGINNDHVTAQGLTRKVYACELFPDARNALHGLAKKTGKATGVSAATISHAWIKRWVAARSARAEVLEALAISGGQNLSVKLRQRADCADLEDPARLPQLELDIPIPELPRELAPRTSRIRRSSARARGL